MTFSELVNRISEETGVPATKVKRIMEASNNEVLKVLMSGEDVKLPGFGTFYTVDVKPKVLFGGKRRSKGRLSVRFRMSREATNGQIWRSNR